MIGQVGGLRATPFVMSAPLLFACRRLVQLDHFDGHSEASLGQAGGNVRQDLVGKMLNDFVGAFDQDLDMPVGPGDRVINIMV